MLNGYVKCKESSGPYFKAGQVARVVDGSLQRPDGSTGTSIYKDLDDLNDRNCGLYSFEIYIWEPAKKLLESGMKLILNNGEVRYVLLETDCVYFNSGQMVNRLSEYDDELNFCDNEMNEFYGVSEIYSGDILIAKRGAKETESLKKQALDLVEKLHEALKKIQDKVSS